MKIYTPLYATQQVLDLLNTLQLGDYEKITVLKLAKTILTDSQEKIFLGKVDSDVIASESNDATSQ